MNDEEVATFYVRAAGEKVWRKSFSLDVAGYNHNMADGFMSLRPAIFAAGSGSVTFRNLRYEACSPNDRG